MTRKILPAAAGALAVWAAKGSATSRRSAPTALTGRRFLSILRQGIGGGPSSTHSIHRRTAEQALP